MTKELELQGDLMDEYLAIQEAEKAEDIQVDASEVSELLVEMWEEEHQRQASIEEEQPYTEQDAFRDFIEEQHEAFN